MGGVVSAGSTNSELVDNLVNAEILKSSEVEKVFRAVDRGVYYLPEHREGAYKDRAWKHNNLHLSAPCIYGEVMEALELKKGMSFLNLGSGTGYLSTMAGLILGTYGINHGVEIHQDVVDYSETQLREFVSSNEFFDAFEFCSPVFHNGNCLNLAPNTLKYDRVYCGAACLPENEDYMKSLVKIGGLLVMPLHDELVKIRRISENKWESNGIMAVSFADLIPSCSSEKQLFELSEPIVPNLQELCRVTIRSVLRKNLEDEHPGKGLFALKCDNTKTKKPKNDKKNFPSGEINLDDTNSSQRPFIRVSFLPSGGRFMFIRNFSDNDEDEDDNVSGFGTEVDNDSRQYSDDADDVRDHVDNDNENLDNHDIVDEENHSVDPMNCISSNNDSNLGDQTKCDSSITAKINAVSLDKNLVGSYSNHQADNQVHEEDISDKELSCVVGNQTLDKFPNDDKCSNSVDKLNDDFKISKCDNVLQSQMNSDDFIGESQRTSQMFKRRKMSDDFENCIDAKKSAIVDQTSFENFTQNLESTSENLNECMDMGDISEKTLLAENGHEISKVSSCNGEIRSQLMSVSSGIGTHESLEMDDITGFESSYDQHDLQTGSSLSSSSPSSLSPSSPPHSKNSNQSSDPKDVTLKPSTSSGDSKRDHSPDVEEESQEFAEPDVELLNYKMLMKDRISALPIPFMLKKFLLHYRE